jgi:Sap, sulfolipid-1-addressing protein
MVGFGLSVAFTSPGSVVTMIVLLSMPAGLRRGIAFICGWLLAIGVLALLVVFVFHGQDFGSKHTTPSRTASAVEVFLGGLLLVSSWRIYRRPTETTGPQSPPKWLDRIERTHWLLAVGVGSLMLSYALSLAAVAEILKANVSTPDAVVASVVFALTHLDRHDRCSGGRRALCSGALRSGTGELESMDARELTLHRADRTDGDRCHPDRARRLRLGSIGSGLWFYPGL